MRFDNDDSLHEAILKELAITTDGVSEDIVADVMSSVQDVVYSIPKGTYQRLGFQGGFIGSWTKDIKSKGDSVKGTVFSDPNLMVASHPSHQSPDGVDRRANMDAHIAEGTGYDYSYIYNPAGGYTEYWKEPRDYWTPVLEKLTDEYIGNLYKNAFGMNVIFKKS